jgi:Mn-dependent DtxR family transcriptional regulator
MRRLTESLENYLKTILILKERFGAVRSVDIAAELGFSRPSVCRAVGILKRDGLLEASSGNYLELTNEGLCLAETLRERYDCLTRFLSEFLGIDAATANDYACRMEHILSGDAFSRLREKTSAAQ